MIGLPVLGMNRPLEFLNLILLPPISLSHSPALPRSDRWIRIFLYSTYIRLIRELIFRR